MPSQVRPDTARPRHWQFEAIYATDRAHDLAVSPDGRTVAFVLSSEGTSDIWLADLEAGSLRRLTADREPASFWEDSTPVWSPDGERIAYASGGALQLISRSGGVPSKGHVEATPNLWLDDGRLVITVERERVSRLAIVEPDDPWPVPFGPDDGDVSNVVAAGEGRLLATFWPKDDRNRSDLVIAEPNGKWSTFVGHPDRRARGATVTGTRVAYLLEHGDWTAVFLTDLDGSEHAMLAVAEADFGDLGWSSDGATLVATRTARGRADVVTIGMGGEVTTIASGGFWQSPKWAGEAMVAIEESATVPPRLVLFRGESKSIVQQGAPLLVDAAPHVEPEVVTYTSLDGTEIEGFLFRPSGQSRPVPAVVYPHGGPTSAYADEWDGHAQYFIDRGYAWFAINFRGSTTYGLEFERANHRDWGLGDTDDCVAAGMYLQNLDWVDERRVGIFGASYGSYLALASLVHPDNPFACGVAKYGDCNILTSWAQGDRVGSDDLERMMGHPSANPDAYRKGSPIHEIERIDKPILIAHGEQDERVNLKQSEELVAELSRLGKTYEYVTYPSEGHGLISREPHLHFYQRLERFLDWYLM